MANVNVQESRRFFPLSSNCWTHSSAEISGLGGISAVEFVMANVNVQESRRFFPLSSNCWTRSSGETSGLGGISAVEFVMANTSVHSGRRFEIMRMQETKFDSLGKTITNNANARK
jgi:hypothetical protein